MIDLTKTVLDESILVGGKRYPIHASFRYIIKALEAIESGQDWSFIFIDMAPLDEKEALDALLDFINEKRIIPRTEGTGERVLDFRLDAPFIYSAFFQCYKIDLLKTDLHWWQFQALLEGLTGTRLNEILEIRCTKSTGKNIAARRLKAAWALPTVATEATGEVVKLFD